MWKVTRQGHPRPQGPLRPHRRRGHPRRLVHLAERSCSPPRSTRRSTGSSRTSTRTPTPVVRQKRVVQRRHRSGRGRIDRSLVPEVRRTEGVAEADGTLQGFAWVVKRDGTVLNKTTNGPPALGFACDRVPRPEPVPPLESSRARKPAPAAPDGGRDRQGDGRRSRATRSATIDVRVSAGTGRGEVRARRHRRVRRRRRAARRDERPVHPGDARTASFEADGKVDEIGVTADSGVSRAGARAQHPPDAVESRRTSRCSPAREITTEIQNDVKEHARRSSTRSFWSSA